MKKKIISPLPGIELRLCSPWSVTILIERSGMPNLIIIIDIYSSKTEDRDIFLCVNAVHTLTM
jgi:hypothetical protein